MSKIILLNKPFNVLCQFTDKEGRATLSDYINDKNVYAAGRLDYDSEGLLVLTDDGQLQHQISHPNHKQLKTYWAQVEGAVDNHAIQPLIKGITLNDGSCAPAKVTIINEPAIWPRNPPIRQRDSIPTSWLEITVSEGRNRQVRRMTAAIGHPTLRLIRAKVGSWSIDGLSPGESKQLSVHATQKTQAPKRHSRSRKPITKRR